MEYVEKIVARATRYDQLRVKAVLSAAGEVMPCDFKNGSTVISFRLVKNIQIGLLKSCIIPTHG